MGRPRTAAALLLAALLLGLTACGTDPAPVEVRPVAGVEPEAPPAVPEPPAGPPGALTGVPGADTAPVVALKVDNAPQARPYHRGLERAAIVWQELVEGGGTRLLAVWADGVPGEVGPVRSVRESDLELVRQLGPVALGFSGGNSGVLSGVAKAVRAGEVVDVSFDALPSAYRRAEQRSDARNFFTDPTVLAAERPGARAVPVFSFGPVAGGVPATTATAVFSRASTVDVAWQAGSSSYALEQDGTAMDVAPANVLVLRVPVRSSRYSDVNGNPTPYVVTTGAGEAVLLRDGLRVDATWSRPAPADPTVLTAADGSVVPLAPGPTWVLLVPLDGSFRTG